MVRQQKNILGANSIAPADSIPKVFRLFSGKCGETIAVVYELTKRTQEKLFADWVQ